MIQTLIAVVRSRSSWNMLRINERVDGATVAPAIPRRARVGDQHPSAPRERREHRRDTEHRRADEQQSPATDAIAEGPQ